MRSFLDLISSENPESNYPYSTPEYREMFRHTLWMVPGVKEASALSRLLKDHPVFGAYKVANVAGDGDAEMPYDNALTLVKQVIKANRYTITISCGKLTTGVTVPEWTAVMMLTGSASTAASGYMQTIFRVQSAGVLDGKQKERCYVFDFAPDRALNVISEVNRITKRGRTNEEQNRAALGEFLNFCPVIAVDGTQMTAYSVSKMMRQIKRLTVDRAIKSGFDDESVYKQDTGIVMDEDDVQLFHTLSDKLSEQKAAKKETKVHINHQGLTGEEYEKADKISNKPKRERTKEDDDLLKKLQEQKKEREKVIRLLRNVSIRLPLLIYGAKVDLTESIKMADFITLVDEESWQEFMPKTVDKPPVPQAAEILRRGCGQRGGSAHPPYGKGCGRAAAHRACEAHCRDLQPLPQPRQGNRSDPVAGGEPSSEQHGGRLLLPQRAVRFAGGSGGASSGGSGAGH